ncbi:amino acid adenylation domain-containing protein [Saccharothrix sp. AJ9571]|nr:amino acid adenylation domain-containing protein [Saccharothrix sp. AJ9571]
MTTQVDVVERSVSTGQDALWSAYLSAPAGTAYNVGIAAEVDRQLDPALLAEALRLLADRHEVLRSTFAQDDDGVLRRLVDRAAGPELVVRDGDGLDVEQVRRLARDLCREPFRPQVRPAARLAAVHRGDRTVLVLAAHHLITDHLSHGTLFTELLRLCGRLSGEPVEPLPGRVRAFDDHVAAERALLSGAEVDRLRQFWLDALRGADTVLDLPRDRPRPARRGYTGETERVAIPSTTLTALTELATTEEVSRFTLVLAVLQIVLHRYTGQTDFLVACPGSTRASGFEGTVGFFVNPVAMRSRVVPDHSLRAHLKAVHERGVAALRHGAYPFALVPADLRVPRDPAVPPLCQVAFGYRHAYATDPLLDLLARVENGEGSGASAEIGGATVTPMDLPQQEGQFDLAFEVVESSAGATLVVRYDTDLFESAGVRLLAGQVVHALAETARDPDVAVRRLRIGPPGGPVEPRPAAATGAPLVVESVVDAARTTPDRVAVDGSRRLTYGDLLALGRRLAARVADLPSRALVAVLCPDPTWTAAVAVATWTTGRAFLPLDSRYPPQRIEFMVRDSGAALLVTTRSADRPAGVAVPVVHVEDLTGDLTGDLAADRTGDPVTAMPGPGRDDTAYVIYTSGSTGAPKGVPITHGALANLAAWQRDYFKVRPEDRVMQCASPGFDAFVWELAMAQGCGATLACGTGPAVLVGADLRRALVERAPTLLTITPTALRTIDSGDVPASLRTVVLAGETCPPVLVERWQPVTDLVNAYGPTEATICATAYRFDRPDGPVRIGTPLPGVDTVVVDGSGEPVPAGVVGELLIGGAGVARGYLARRALTAERFTERDGRRFYHSGDLVRWDASGNLRFVGRTDRQIKVHGHRVEPGEVEHVLADHPTVADTAVAVLDVRSSEALVGYVTGAPRVDLDDLRRHVARVLPHHLRPHHLIEVDHIPLTAHGKLDFAALPRPAADPSRSGSPIAPGGVRGTLAEVWTRLLGPAELAEDSDFFRLGGHSLLATKAAHLLTTALGTSVGVAELMARPRFGELVDHLEQAVGRAPRAPAAPVPVTPADAPFPLTEVQQAYWIGHRDDFELGGLPTTGYVELATRHVDAHRLEDAWNAVVRRHDMLRAVITPEGRQRVLIEVPRCAVAVHDHRDSAPAVLAAHLRQLRRDMAEQPLDPTRWPSSELRVTRCPDGETRVHLAVNGVFVDGSSLMVLLGDLGRAHRDPAGLPPPPATRFADVVAALAVSDADRLPAARAYWLDRLATLPDPPQLPAATDTGRSDRAEFTSLHRRIPAATWSAIRATASARGLTASSVLLTAYAAVLATWAGRRHFTVNTTASRRPGGQAEEVVGNFTGLMLTEIDLTARQSFELHARRVQRQVAHDLEHVCFDAVRVLRERMRLTDDPVAGTAPIVFTSVLDGAGGHRDGVGALELVTTRTPQVLVDHVVFEQRGELALRWNVRAGQLPDGVADSMFESYTHVIESLADDDTWQVPLRVPLPARDRAERSRANSTTAPMPRTALHEAFFSSARRAPERSAVHTADRTLTYGELAERALAVSGELRRRRVCAEELVAVAATRGWPQIAAVLGVLHAAAAYLPVDVDLPPERQRRLVADAGARFVLTSAATALPASVTDTAEVIVVDDLPGDQDAPPPSPVTGSNLAYTIYTSGSTGTPKGVMVEHAAAGNTVEDINRRYALGPDDVVLALSALSFDLSVFDVFGPLSVGASLVVPTADRALDPAHWLDLVRRHRVTVWNSVPVLLRLALDRVREDPTRNAALSSLRLVLLSGDWVPRELPGELGRQACAQVAALGGATEAAIWSIHHEVGDLPDSWPSVPYGTPLANQTFHVLDEDLRDCPAWVVGELHIGGAGLARGYLHDDQRTRDRFITHPETGDRLYRTGDLGRYRRDGVIEFLGRADSQVKISGHRLELGEVEAVLARHPQVESAVVTAPERDGGRYLHAHVVTRTAPAGDHPPVLKRAAPAVLSGTGAQAAAEHAARVRVDHVHQQPLQTMKRFEDLVEQAATRTMYDLVASTGLLRLPGGRCSAEDLMRILGAARRYRPLFGRWLRVLGEAGLLRVDGHHVTTARPVERATAAELWNACEAAATWEPGGALLVDYLRRCADRAGDLLTGETDPLELLFPGGNLDVADALYSDNPITRLCNEVVAHAMGALTGQGRDTTRLLRVLELGGGTGATTRAVMPMLPLHDRDYLFTDVSDYLIDRTRRRLGQYPFLRFARLDVNTLAHSPLVQPAAFDLVLAVNVLHNARDLDATLGHVRRLLAPGGSLLLVEGTGRNRMQLISLAFLEGLAEPTDDREDGEVLLSEARWLDKLTAAGFVTARTLLGADHLPVVALAQTVILAQAPPTAQVLSGDAVRDHLRRHLPAHAVPHAVTELIAAPLNAHGKVDRSALTRQAAPPRRNAPAAKPPPGDRPAHLAEVLDIWRDVLGRPDSQPEKNLFDSGGDSLSAIQLSARLRERFGVDVSPRDLLGAASITAIARLVEGAHPAPAQAPQRPSRPAPAQAEVLPVSVRRDRATYAYSAMPLCVVLGNGGEEWAHNRYVDLYSTSLPARPPYLDFVDSFGYGDFLDVHTLDLAATEGIDIIEFLRAQVGGGNYAVVYLDDHHLRGLPSPHVHEILVHGYDDGAGLVHAVGYDNDRLLSRLSFDYALFAEAFARGRTQMTGANRLSDVVAPIQLLTPPRTAPGLDLAGLVARLEHYLRPDATRFGRLDRSQWWWWSRPAPNPAVEVRMGLDTYDHLVRYLDSAEPRMGMDYRTFHLLYEHKSAMAQRLTYLRGRLGDLPGLATGAAAYTTLTDEFNDLRLVVLRHLHDPRPDLITGIPALLHRTRERESAVLAGVVDALGEVA